ncbi:MAG: SEC-C domain-containing protein [Saccharospirillaceae bacterium]|nr:SEC-C domain-containing protein [Saccharospirillaceae bacterium]
MAFSPITIPQIMTVNLKQACAEISNTNPPVFIEKKLTSKSELNHCVLNAQAEAEIVEGKVIYGWQVFVWENVLFQFVAHAIVELENRLYCVTHSKYADKQILFVPDDLMTFDFNNPNSRLPCKDIAISKKREVIKLLEIRGQIRSIKMQYPISNGNILISKDDSQVISELEKVQSDLLDRVNYLLYPIKNKCPCDSGKQFKKCCRPHMKRTFK